MTIYLHISDIKLHCDVIKYTLVLLIFLFCLGGILWTDASKLRNLIYFVLFPNIFSRNFKHFPLIVLNE